MGKGPMKVGKNVTSALTCVVLIATSLPANAHWWMWETIAENRRNTNTLRREYDRTLPDMAQLTLPPKTEA